MKKRLTILILGNLAFIALYPVMLALTRVLENYHNIDFHAEASALQGAKEGLVIGLLIRFISLPLANLIGKRVFEFTERERIAHESAKRLRGEA